MAIYETIKMVLRTFIQATGSFCHRTTREVILQIGIDVLKVFQTTERERKIQLFFVFVFAKLLY